MANATPDTTKRKRPDQAGTPVMVRIQPDQLAALDAFIDATDPIMSRQDAIRKLLAIVSAVPGGDALSEEVGEQAILVEKGRSWAAAYARNQGHDEYARRIEAGELDGSPLVQIMMWQALP